MDRFAHVVTHRKKTIIAAFLVIAAVCAACATFVRINYDMVDYLPANAQSTIALEIMSDEFGSSIPNASVMVKDVSLIQALDYKQQLLEINGVSEVLWLDDVVDIRKPLEMADRTTVESFYRNGNALFTVTIEKGTEITTSRAIRALIGEQNALAGEAPNLAAMQQATGSEATNAFIILLPVIILILILASTSWVEPLLYLFAIGISIVINMGTNIFLGEVSFMTNAVSPILQLAVSIDYAIFLLHSFSRHRQSCEDVTDAMRRAIGESFSIVAGSAAAAMFGFMALMFMEFRIGLDMGLVLAKGILLSFITVMVFLPPLTLLGFKLIDKTRHRPFMPEFHGVNRFLSKLAIPVLVVVVLAIVPSFLGQNHTGFLYGNESATESSEIGAGKREIEEQFGQTTTMALLVSRGDIAKEQMLSTSLEKLEHVTSVVSYANQVGTAIPVAFLDESVVSRFYSENYARIVVYVDTPEEGDLAFDTVKTITATAQSYYGDEVYSAGQSANLYDMKNVVEKDKLNVDMIAVAAIFLVLLITFRSGLLPFMLLLAIEAAIWINLSIPYFTGTSINFIGFLVLSTVQLAATVDYAILLSINYMRNRKIQPQKEAMHVSMGTAFRPILVSAVILATAGFILFITSTNPAVSDIGMLLCRGALLAFAMVACFLPGMMKVFDWLVAKTTWRAGFVFAKKDKASASAQHESEALMNGMEQKQ